MANPGVATIWDQPNYFGELFTADVNQTPLLSMIGGLGGTRETSNFEFPTGVLFDMPTPGQPAISEDTSVKAPAGTAIIRSQEKNVVQIHHETIELTYVKESNFGRLSGLNTGGTTANPVNEKAWQIAQRLVKIAKDVEHSFIRGQYQISTASNVPNKTRGLLELCASGNTIAAAGAALDITILKTMYRLLADNGAFFDNMVFFVNSVQKQVITSIYETRPGFGLPQTRNVGGLNITEIETDFFKGGVVYSRFVPQDTVLIADVAHLAAVSQPVPGKGHFFEEVLAKEGAAERLQIFGQIGLAHGPAFLHGSITGLAN